MFSQKLRILIIKIKIVPSLFSGLVFRLPGEFELTVGWSFGTERADDFAVDVEYLNAVIVAVRNNDTIRVRHGDVVRMLQVAFLAAHYAELADKRAVRLENLQR